jgi:parallel beta-helix repeat protein
MKPPVFLLILVISVSDVPAQPTQAWVSRFDIPGSNGESGHAITFDAQGNVYVAGITSDSTGRFVTTKYNRSGTQVWASYYDPPQHHEGTPVGIVADMSGNVYVAGGSASEEEGPQDYVTIKYNSAGVEQWANRYNGSGNDNDTPVGIGLDNAGNVYVSGTSREASLSQFLVTDPSDAPADSVPVFSPPTLRAAIQCANYNPNLDEIRFNVPTIVLSSSLPVVTNPVIIDGQVGTSSKVALTGLGTFGLWINGSGITVKNMEIMIFPVGGIAIQGNGNTVRNCDIHDNIGPGIVMNFVTNSVFAQNKIYGHTGTSGFGIDMILASNYNRVDSNLIGTANGLTASPNSRAGILLRCQYNTIRNNVISGNAAEGIRMDAAGSDTSRGNMIDGNKIGTTAAGDGPLANATYGISALIGISDTVRGNVISGNGTSGIGISSSTRGLLIEGNLIGPKANGTDSLGNTTGINSSGVNIEIRNNTISSNRSGGISLQGIGTAVVRGNRIGTTFDGTLPLGNSAGLSIAGSAGHVIGGPDPSDRNTISGNRGNGVEISGSGSTNVTVQGNYIGVNSQGAQEVPNGGDGIAIYNRASNNTIKSNVISGNRGSGIRLGSTFNPHHNVVVANRIGTNKSGSYVIPNGFYGIQIYGSAANTIGGSRINGEHNIISGNYRGGILVMDGASSGNHIKGNLIGTDQSGAQPLGNEGHGILIMNADSNVIGGLSADSANVISANDSSGVAIVGNSSAHNLIRNNRIGTDESASTAHPNNFYGVFIDNSADNMIGGNRSNGEGNLITGNNSGGVLVRGNFSSRNRIVGNFIGRDQSGTPNEGNHGHGILIMNADSNAIGGSSADSANVISGNDSSGVAIIGGVAAYNTLRANIIGRSSTGAVEVPNATGVLIRGANKNSVGGASQDILNIISGNHGNGITIIGDSNIVQRNSIDSNGRNPATPPGSGHGVFVEGNRNTIGRGIQFMENTGNLIRNNGRAGVFINSGWGNTVLGDTVYENRGLGVDLAPEWVTRNDSADIDQGPNGNQNFPVVDSARIEAPNTTVFGRLVSKPNRTYIIEFFVNDKCDSTRYGEGKRRLDTTLVTVAANDTGVFSKQLPVVLDTNLVLTMTATDDSGSTSEFSRCWPKFFKIVDVDSVRIPNKDFVVYKVRNDPPTFTETLIDTFATDDRGFIALGTEDAEEGDSIKVYRFMHTERSEKRASLTPVTAYTVHLDNGKFDTLTYRLSYDAIDSSIVQRIVMDHTTIAYNLFVSVEWDAELMYIDSLKQAFRNLANYMYDVSDGQMRFDTIRIADNKGGWRQADIRTFASNVWWPETNKTRCRFRPDNAATMVWQLHEWPKHECNRVSTQADAPLPFSNDRTRVWTLHRIS